VSHQGRRPAQYRFEASRLAAASKSPEGSPQMELVAQILIGVVAALHAYFLILEMFLWRRPFGLKTFGMTQEVADSSATLAANQGLYNGFLAAGLVWSLVAADPAGFQFRVFFLLCVIVAGVYGGVTVSRRILYIQAFPAVLALVFVLLSR
jgi:putative membrane protein